ncbi:MAG: small subunit ribosomal protein S20 [Candidatus Midichloriaceae bacterium]|jgi:small subunit ribosomal protein S20
MAHQSAIKAHKQSIKRALRNRSVLTMINTFSKKVEKFVVSKEYDNAKEALSKAESIIMKAVTKNVLKLNTASRKVSNLCRKVKSIEAK